MKAVKAGDPLDPATDMGPLSSFAQRDTVLGQIAAAKDAGGRLLFGGEQLDLPGAYLSAGVLIDLPRDSVALREEIFGPIAIVIRVTDIDDAIAVANDVPFGLGSSVWTTNSAEQERFVRELACGMTAINQMLASTPEAPFGGIKRSGHGRELGPFGLHEFMNLKTVFHPAGAGS
jgi:succinate-semialdehyde dehydrogenase/glutarate-semialdehyde dehydrogenase